MFLFSKVQYLFSKDENERILKCVRENEQGTSGEIRIFAESHCSYMDPMMRATELFVQLGMSNTIHRNGVLIYIAYKDQDFALCGDKNIFEKTEQEFWQIQSRKLVQGFFEKKYADSLIRCINEVGKELQKHFPFHGEKKNELPDEIVFGK
jgi:uncharacterized membrane protein